MENQQVSNLLFENVDINKLKTKNLQDETKISNIINDIHQTYEFLKNEYGLTRDMAKRFKHKLYNQYEANIPTGYKQDPYSDLHLVNKEGDIIRKRTRMKIELHKNGRGYLQYCGSNKKSVRVHKSVARAFIPNNDESRYYINHKDGNKQNNHVSNLEWVTPTENVIHAFSIGLIDKKVISEKTRGEGNSQAVLSKEDVLDIRNLKKVPPHNLAEHYGVSRTTIYDIWKRRSWSYI